MLLGRHDSVGKSQTNSGNSNIATATTIQPSKAASPRPPAEETLHQPVARATEWLSMDDPPYKEKVYSILLCSYQGSRTSQTEIVPLFLLKFIHISVCTIS